MKKLLAILLLLAIDPVLSQELDLTNAMPSGPLIQTSGFENCQIFQGSPTCGEWNNTGLGDWGKYENSSKEFLFSYDTTRLWQNIDITSLNTNQFAYYFYFDLNASCKNSIGGYCENPDGPADFFSARLNFFAGETLFKQDILLDGPIYTQDWTPFFFSGQIDSANQITSIQVEFYGQDVGYWAGFYGPRLDNPQLSILYNEIQIAVDCQLTPYDPTCIIQDLTTFSDEELLALTDITTDTGDNGSDDGSEPIIEEDEEETFVADETTEETNLEETLQDEETSSDDEVVVAEANEREVTYRELTDEEKAAILADAISKNTLELALSVAENAATNTATTTTETVATTSSRTTIVSEDNADKVEDNKNDNDEQVADNTDTANDLLENGRQLNNVSMAATQSQTEQSASDSINQAESIAMSSSEIKGSESIIDSITIDSVIDNSSNASNNGSEVEMIVEQSNVETIVEEVVANNIDQSVETSNETFDSFADIMNIVISPTIETKDEDLEFVQSILAQTEQKVDETANTFDEDEKVTIQNDPNLSNAFNVVPNTANLEILGVLSNKQDDKSDAEKRAEQVVAANKEQQEEINKNYMDADQSGIVAAMGADTDVASYRNAMLNDNNIWYKPEDIYKNVVYKDNVRGAYFLEKGNTDTYKKMVEEQYK